MILAKELHIQPSEIDNMPFYWIEMLVEMYTENVEKENARYKEQESQQRNQYNTPTNIRQPNISVPKINMPSMSGFKK